MGVCGGAAASIIFLAHSHSSGNPRDQNPEKEMGLVYRTLGPLPGGESLLAHRLGGGYISANNADPQGKYSQYRKGLDEGGINSRQLLVGTYNVDMRVRGEEWNPAIAHALRDGYRQKGLFIDVHDSIWGAPKPRKLPLCKPLI